MEFKHPKYYAALRAEYRKLQASSSKPQAPSDSSSKRQASSSKRQASSSKQQASLKLGPSSKLQATSFKRQAASNKRLDRGPWIKYRAPLIVGRCFIEQNGACLRGVGVDTHVFKNDRRIAIRMV